MAMRFAERRALMRAPGAPERQSSATPRLRAARLWPLAADTRGTMGLTPP